MSLLTRAFILDRYGPRLSIRQLAELLQMAEGTIRNQISAETFPIATYREGAARFAPYGAVADYLDAMEERVQSRSD